MADDTSHSDGRHRRWIVAALAAVLAAVPIIIGIAISSGSVKAEPATGNSYSPVAEGPATTPAAEPSTRRPVLPPGPGVLVAIVRHDTLMRAAPGGHAFAKLTTKTEFGSPEVLWVRAHRGSEWLGVVSVLAGNGKLGWIRRSATSLTRETWTINVSLSARKLIVLNRGKLQKQFTVAVGRPDAPTPTGSFSVTDRLATGDPSGPYGCCILALSAKSPHAIQGWSGGDRIAIHSTPAASSIGLPVSHGCLRLTLADGRWLLAHVPLGTPTRITA